MYRILVFGMTENPGGVESFLMNYYRHINRELVQFDFLCNTYQKVAFEDEIVSYGGCVFHIAARSDNYFRFHKELDAVFKDHAGEWNAVWVNVCSLANVDYLKIARKYGIQRRIIHSHNSQNMDSKLRGLLHAYNKKRIAFYATDFWACSSDAAKWFYSGVTLNKAVIIHNAIDVDSMKFDPAKRNQLRTEHGWEDKYVIGNVGRLHFQKNQSFLLDVFSLYRERNPESVLALVGQGEDEQMLKEKAQRLGISEVVFFAGVQTDIQAWLSSFDLFAFPSVFEGLSVALLEAQANGLPVITSKKVLSEDLIINDNFSVIEIDDVAAWVKEIEKMHVRVEYEKIKADFVRNGYDISSQNDKAETMFLSN